MVPQRFPREVICVTVLGAVIKHLTKKPNSWRVQFILVGRAGKQEWKAAGYMAFAVRKQREMNAGAQLACLFHSVQLWGGALTPGAGSSLASPF